MYYYTDMYILCLIVTVSASASVHVGLGVDVSLDLDVGCECENERICECIYMFPNKEYKETLVEALR